MHTGLPARKRWREGALIVAVLLTAAALLLRQRRREDDRIIVRVDTARIEARDTVRIRR